MLSEPEPVQFETWLLRVGPPMDRDKFTIDGKFCLDDVVRYERLETELDRICQRLGVEWIPSRLPTFKVGVRPEKATAAWLYTDAARAIIRQAYAFELDYFGYDFPSEA